MGAFSTFTRGRGRPKSQPGEKIREQLPRKESGTKTPLKIAQQYQTSCYGLFLHTSGIITAAEKDAAFHYKRLTERYMGALGVPGFSSSNYGEKIQSSIPWTSEDTAHEKHIIEHYRDLSNHLKKYIKPYTLQSFDRWSCADITPDAPHNLGTQMQFKEVCKVILEYIIMPGGY